LDPDHLVLATIDYNFPSNSVYVSIDGGANWDGPHQTKYLRDDLGSGGDPVLIFDSQGNVYATSISIGVTDYSIGSAGGEALISSMAVASSNDGGYTWNEPVSAARSDVQTEVELDPSGRIRGTISLSFLDKPWLATGPHPTIEDQEMIYLSYTEFVTQYDILYIGELPVLGIPETLTTPKLAASSDAGVTWSEPQAVGPTVRSTFGEGEDGGGNAGVAELTLDEIAEPTLVNAGDDSAYRDEVMAALTERRIRTQQPDQNSNGEGTKRTIQGPVPMVDSKGTVYVTWLDSTNDDAMKGIGELYMARSDDGGSSWEKPTRIASFLEPGYRPRNAFFRYWASAFPKVAVGPKDELYVIYTALPPDKPYDEGDVFFIRSTDGGKRWSRPKALNQDESNSVQFFPAVAVSPNGVIHVMWGDMRDDAVATRYHIYYTSSEDGGESWGFKNEQLDLTVGDARVTDFPTNPNKAFPSGAFIGDYFSIAATDEEAYMVWADGRLAEYGGTNQKIGFARKRAVPSPEIFLSPDAGPGGETITVQGHGFQPDMNYYLQVGGETVTVGRSSDDGVITASVFVPISGEGAHSVSLVDESGNAAATSFYMEFGFDNVQTELQSLNDEIEALMQASVPITSASSGVNPVAPQLIRNDAGVVGLQTEVQELKGLVKSLVAQQTGAATTSVAASGLFTGDSSLSWGLAALAGLLLGAAFMYVRKNGE
ncbi:MAG: IPT/TIG domain-containing protein, partial [Chloroflexota bacterium]|nr:IPT/TIG domain-containing protein [Chloroflexota bacterium]